MLPPAGPASRRAPGGGRAKGGVPLPFSPFLPPCWLPFLTDPQPGRGSLSPPGGSAGPRRALSSPSPSFLSPRSLSPHSRCPALAGRPPPPPAVAPLRALRGRPQGVGAPAPHQTFPRFLWAGFSSCVSHSTLLCAAPFGPLPLCDSFTTRGLPRGFLFSFSSRHLRCCSPAPLCYRSAHLILDAAFNVAFFCSIF